MRPLFTTRRVVIGVAVVAALPRSRCSCNRPSPCTGRGPARRRPARTRTSRRASGAWSTTGSAACRRGRGQAGERPGPLRRSRALDQDHLHCRHARVVAHGPRQPASPRSISSTQHRPGRGQRPGTGRRQAIPSLRPAEARRAGRPRKERCVQAAGGQHRVPQGLPDMFSRHRRHAVHPDVAGTAMAGTATSTSTIDRAPSR